VKRGEVVGIIGRNGAGKSTLLKILSRITEPTEGRVTLRGRVASLLEVGTGFHPELTGRENIFLNGAVLGMSRAEIVRKFDEIVVFAEIERFLDTPVKRYSSGMYVRLAFAVAAHLEPEILIVDEVLAVGDAQFQQKCMGRMQSVARRGRTVLFVSHNMAAVSALCSRAIMLLDGTLAADERVSSVVDRYLSATSASTAAELSGRHRYGNGMARINWIATLHSMAGNCNVFRSGEPIRIRFGFDSKHESKSWHCAVGVRAMDWHVVAAVNTDDLGLELPRLEPGSWTGEIEISSLRLVPGRYQIGFGVCNGGDVFDYIEDALTLEIAQTPVYGTRALNGGWGVVVPDWKFTVNRSGQNVH
jgi:lipopolysaccharide transport system ATP-binding protein